MEDLSDLLVICLALCTLSISRAESDCTSALGMQSNAITDDKISSSSYSKTYQNATWPPWNGRLFNRSNPWCADENHQDKNQWLQVNLSSTKQITAVAVQGQYKRRVYSYFLNYSLDGDHWSTYDELLHGPNDTSENNDYVKVLVKPFPAQFIRFNPHSWRMFSASSNKLHICMRVEIYGCNVEIGDCSVGSQTCHTNAVCIFHEGEHICYCKNGYTGDGVSCYELENEVNNNGDGLRWKSLFNVVLVLCIIITVLFLISIGYIIRTKRRNHFNKNNVSGSRNRMNTHDVMLSNTNVINKNINNSGADQDCDYEQVLEEKTPRGPRSDANFDSRGPIATSNPFYMTVQNDNCSSFPRTKENTVSSDMCKRQDKDTKGRQALRLGTPVTFKVDKRQQITDAEAEADTKESDTHIYAVYDRIQQSDYEEAI